MTDSAGITIVEFSGTVLGQPAPFRLASGPAFSFGEMDGDETERFTHVVGGVRRPDGAFLILDERESLPLRILNPEGTYAGSIGGRRGGASPGTGGTVVRRGGEGAGVAGSGSGGAGEGPGELERPAAIRIDGEGRILVWDPGRGRIQRFLPDGRFDRDFSERVLGPGAIRGFHSDPDGSFLLLKETSDPGSPEPGVNRRSSQARIVRVGGTEGAGAGTVDTLAVFGGTEWELRTYMTGGEISALEILRPWYLPRLLHTFSGDGVWLSTGTRWEVERRHRSGPLDLVVRFDQPLAPFNSDRVRELHQAMLAGAPDEEIEAAVQRRIQQDEYPERIPPIADLFSDAEGRLWIGVMDFPPPLALPGAGGPSAREWVLLERDGRAVVGRITLPPRSRPLYADADGVLLAVVDELDIPRVEWWPFESD